MLFTYSYCILLLFDEELVITELLPLSLALLQQYRSEVDQYRSSQSSSSHESKKNKNTSSYISRDGTSKQSSSFFSSHSPSIASTSRENINNNSNDLNNSDNQINSSQTQLMPKEEFAIEVRIDSTDPSNNLKEGTVVYAL